MQADSSPGDATWRGRGGREVQLRAGSGRRLPAGGWDGAAWPGVAARKPATRRRRPALVPCRRPCVREPRGLVVGGGCARVGAGQGPRGLRRVIALPRARGVCAEWAARGWGAVFVCTRRARRARTFTSDAAAVELRWRSPGAVARPPGAPSPGLRGLQTPVPAPPRLPSSPAPADHADRGDRDAPGKVVCSAVALVWECFQASRLRRG